MAQILIREHFQSIFSVIWDLIKTTISISQQHPPPLHPQYTRTRNKDKMKEREAAADRKAEHLSCLWYRASIVSINNNNNPSVALLYDRQIIRKGEMKIIPPLSSAKLLSMAEILGSEDPRPRQFSWKCYFTFHNRKMIHPPRYNKINTQRRTFYQMVTTTEKVGRILDGRGGPFQSSCLPVSFRRARLKVKIVYCIHLSPKGLKRKE